MMIVDTHTHLFCEEFNEDLPETIERAKSAGVARLLMPNIDCSTLDDLLRTCESYKGYCFPMLGLHPTSVNADFRKELDSLKERLKPGHPYIAIGEVGLDLYWDRTYEKEQKEAFIEQLHWALEYDLPLVIHSRSAHEMLMECMEPYKSTPLRGIFHSFTGTEEEASQLFSFENFLLGINGVVTFKKSTLPDVLKASVPVSRVVVETDSPYLAPVPHRGKRNESAYVRDVLQKVADIYGLSLDEAAAVTTQNALRMFRNI